MASASFIIILEDVHHEINFYSLEDFRRILSDEKFEEVLNTENLEIHRPTIERQQGKLTLLYIIAGDRLVTSTVYNLIGKE